MSNNVVCVDDLANLTTRLNQSRNVLDSVPAAGEGAFWLDVVGDSPVIKFRCRGKIFYVNALPVLVKNPNLSFSQNPVLLQRNSTATVSISHAGGGILSVYLPDSNLLSCNYEAAGQIIVLTANDVQNYFAVNRFDILVSLSAVDEYSSASDTIRIQIGDSADMWNFDNAQRGEDNLWAATVANLISANIGVSISCNSHYKDDYRLVAATDALGNSIADLLWLDDLILCSADNIADCPLPFTLTFKEALDYGYDQSTCTLIIKEALS